MFGDGEKVVAPSKSLPLTSECSKQLLPVLFRHLLVAIVRFFSTGRGIITLETYNDEEKEEDNDEDDNEY